MRVAADHRDAILQTAAHLFARKPFHEVLMDDVAEQVGIGKGTIYRYFPNKEELFAALSMKYMEMMGSETALAAASPGEPLQRLHAVVKRVAELIREHQDFFQVMQRHECELWARRKSEFLTRRSVIRDNIANLIRECVASGDMDCPFQPEVAADMLMGMLRNLLRFGDPPAEPAQMSKMVMHVFIKGLGVRKNGRHS